MTMTTMTMTMLYSVVSCIHCIILTLEEAHSGRIIIYPAQLTP